MFYILYFYAIKVNLCNKTNLLHKFTVIIYIFTSEQKNIKKE